MCTIRKGTYSFATLCNWNRELSYSIKELSNTANMSAALKFNSKLPNSIRELSYSIRQLFNWIGELLYPMGNLSSSIKELSNWIGEYFNWRHIENSEIELQSSLNELERSAIQTESYPIH